MKLSPSCACLVEPEFQVICKQNILLAGHTGSSSNDKTSGLDWKTPEIQAGGLTVQDFASPDQFGISCSSTMNLGPEGTFRSHNQAPESH